MTAVDRRVTDIIRTDDDHDVGVLKLRVDLVELKELLIRHVRLSQEDVHMPRHTPSDRVNRIAHFNVICFEHASELRVLWNWAFIVWRLQALQHSATPLLC